MQIDPSLTDPHRSELKPGEQFLWAGRPNPAGMALGSLGGTVFGVFWCGFLVNFLQQWYRFPSRDASGPAGLFGLHGLLSALFFVPFVLIGLGALLSPLWAYLGARKTFYGITNERVLIVQCWRGRKVTSYYPTDLGPLERRERPDGSGDLSFARITTKDSDGDPKVVPVKFSGIPAVRQVEELLRRALIAPESSSPASRIPER
jgi:hypothetical protein